MSLPTHIRRSIIILLLKWRTTLYMFLYLREVLEGLMLVQEFCRSFPLYQAIHEYHSVNSRAS